MTQPQDSSRFDLSAMLPVGMIAHGGLAAEVLAELARRHAPAPEWRAFHYERQGEVFEVTGGIPSTVEGVRRCLPPHSSVQVSCQSLQEAMHARLGATAPTPLPAPIPAVAPARQTRLLLALALPDDPGARARLLEQLRPGQHIGEAEIEAAQLAHGQLHWSVR